MIKAWINVLVAFIDAVKMSGRTLWNSLLAFLNLLSGKTIEGIVAFAVTVLGAVTGLAAFKEFGLAVVLCSVASLIWLAKALQWTGQTPRHPFVTRAIRAGLAVLALSFTVGSYFGTDAWRNKEPWFRWVHQADSGKEPPRQKSPEAPPQKGDISIPLERGSPTPPRSSPEPKQRTPIASKQVPQSKIQSVKGSSAETVPTSKPEAFDPAAVLPTIVPGKLTAELSEKIPVGALRAADLLIQCMSFYGNNPSVTWATHCANEYRERVETLQSNLRNAGIEFYELDKSVEQIESQEVTAVQINRMVQVLYAVARKMRDMPLPPAPTPTPQLTPGPLRVITTSLTDSKFALPDDIGIPKDRLRSLANAAGSIYQETTNCLVKYSSSVNLVGYCVGQERVIEHLREVRNGLREWNIVIQGLEDVAKELNQSQGNATYQRLATFADVVSRALADKAH
jgi:hypothetical protein